MVGCSLGRRWERAWNGEAKDPRHFVSNVQLRKLLRAGAQRPTRLCPGGAPIRALQLTFLSERKRPLPLARTSHALTNRGGTFLRPEISTVFYGRHLDVQIDAIKHKLDTMVRLPSPALS